jgi:hypothetical protein
VTLHVIELRLLTLTKFDLTETSDVAENHRFPDESVKESVDFLRTLKQITKIKNIKNHSVTYKFLLQKIIVMKKMTAQSKVLMISLLRVTVKYAFCQTLQLLIKC